MGKIDWDAALQAARHHFAFHTYPSPDGLRKYHDLFDLIGSDAEVARQRAAALVVVQRDVLMAYCLELQRAVDDFISNQDSQPSEAA